MTIGWTVLLPLSFIFFVLLVLFLDRSHHLFYSLINISYCDVESVIPTCEMYATKEKEADKVKEEIENLSVEEATRLDNGDYAARSLVAVLPINARYSGWH